MFKFLKTLFKSPDKKPSQNLKFKKDQKEPESPRCYHALQALKEAGKL